MASSTLASPVQYLLDGDDAIIGFNEGFFDFASENGARDLPDRVLETTIWDHLRGYEVQEIYRALFEDVRLSGAVSRFEYRCDALGTRRRMGMEIWATANGGLRLVSTTLEIEPDPDAMPLVEAEGQASLIRGCSFCSRINGPPWMPARQAVEGLRLLVNGSLRMTHGVCAECSERILGERPKPMGAATDSTA